MFADIFEKPLQNFSQLSKKLDEEVYQQSNLVVQAFEKLAEMIETSTEDEDQLLNCTSAVQTFKDDKRHSIFFNHLNAVSEGITALFGINKKISPANISSIIDCVKYYTNRILKQWKGIDLTHMLWVNAWLDLLASVEMYSKEEMKQPTTLNGDSNSIQNNKEMLFEQINQGIGITKNLKPITGDTALVSKSSLSSTSRMLKNQLPSIRCEGKHWFIENQKDAHNLAIKNVEMTSVIYLHNCLETTLRINGKINSITMDNCKRTSILFDSLVSTFEFINCKTVRMQTFGKVPSIIIHKTDGCLIYLSDESLDVEIISSNSTQVNLLAPNSEGQFIDYLIPEQLKTTLIPDKGLHTEVMNVGLGV